MWLIDGLRGKLIEGISCLPSWDHWKPFPLKINWASDVNISELICFTNYQIFLIYGTKWKSSWYLLVISLYQQKKINEIENAWCKLKKSQSSENNTRIYHPAGTVLLLFATQVCLTYTPSIVILMWFKFRSRLFLRRLV